MILVLLQVENILLSCSTPSVSPAYSAVIFLIWGDFLSMTVVLWEEMGEQRISIGELTEHSAPCVQEVLCSVTCPLSTQVEEVWMWGEGGRGEWSQHAAMAENHQDRAKGSQPSLNIKECGEQILRSL
jgi:hypothetical protein